MLEIQFKQSDTDKWRRLGEDGNEFETADEAWPEAQAAANLGMPWAGAIYRLVEIDGGDHADDCALGLGWENGCDCGAEPVIVGERRFFASTGVIERAEGVRSPVSARKGDSEAETWNLKPGSARLGVGTLVVEGVLEPKELE